MAKHRHKRAEGGKVHPKEDHPHLYNAHGAPEAHEAEDHEDEFKRGGHKKKKKRAEGGAVHGTKAAVRLDKRARGGRMSEHSPFSHAKASKEPPKQSSGMGSGHEDEQPGDTDGDQP